MGFYVKMGAGRGSGQRSRVLWLDEGEGTVWGWRGIHEEAYRLNRRGNAGTEGCLEDVWGEDGGKDTRSALLE